MAKIPGLTTRDGVYYYRVRVPMDLISVVGKKEIKTSLGTKDFAEAKKRRNEKANRKTHLNKQKAKGFNVYLEHGDAKYTRVEIRLNPDKPINKLAALKKNPFKRLNLIDIEAPKPPEDDHHWKLFQDACRYRGFQGALNHLPSKLRSQYNATIQSTSGDLWRPKVLWDMWPEIILKSGLVS